MKSIAACAAMLCALSGTAGAAPYSGNEILADLTSKDAASYLAAGRYILGIVDAEEISLAGEKGRPYSRKYFCVPDGATNGQLVDVVRVDLEKNPAYRHYGAVFFVKGALSRAYPCPDNPP